MGVSTCSTLYVPFFVTFRRNLTGKFGEIILNRQNRSYIFKEFI